MGVVPLDAGVGLGVRRANGLGVEEKAEEEEDEEDEDEGPEPMARRGGGRPPVELLVRVDGAGGALTRGAGATGALDAIAVSGLVGSPLPLPSPLLVDCGPPFLPRDAGWSAARFAAAGAFAFSSSACATAATMAARPLCALKGRPAPASTTDARALQGEEEPACTTAERGTVTRGGAAR